MMVQTLNDFRYVYSFNSNTAPPYQALKPTPNQVRYAHSNGTYLTISADEIRADPLGSHPLFYYSDDQLVIVTAGIGALVQELKRCGRPVSVNADAVASTFCCGNLQLADGPILGSTVVDSSYVIKLSAEGPSLKSLAPSKEILGTRHSSLLNIANEVCANLACAVEGKEHILIEMTGGLDSRLTLAAALQLGLSDRIRFATRGSHDNPDRVVAERVAHAFDIEMVSIPYRAQPIDVSQFLENGHFCAGVRWLDDVAFKFNSALPESFVVLTGGMGEIFRNFYAERFHHELGYLNSDFERPMDERAAIEFFSNFAKRTRFLKDRGDGLKSSMINKLVSTDISVGHALYLQYYNNRNRFHYGYSTALRNRYFCSADPLYSQHALHVALNTDTEALLTGAVTCELIDLLFPALNAFPLAEKRHPPSYVANARESRYLKGLEKQNPLKNSVPKPNVSLYPEQASGGQDLEMLALADALIDDYDAGILDNDAVREFVESRGPAEVRQFAKAASSVVALAQICARC